MAPAFDMMKVLGIGTLCTNVYVFSQWHYYPKADRDPNDRSGRPPPDDPVKRAQHVRYMLDNWTMSLRNLREDRWWTLLSAAFSHAEPWHLVTSLWALTQAYRTTRFIGFSPLRLVTLGLGSAVAGSAAYLLDVGTRPQQGRRERGGAAATGHGASGMVCGLFTAAALAVPNIPMGVPFLSVTCRLRSMVLTLAALDLGCFVVERVRGRRQQHPLFGTHVAWSGHLGGTVFGALFYAVALRKYRGLVVPRPRW